MKTATFVVMAVLSAFAMPAISQDATGAERPVLKVGDSWAYQKIDNWNNEVQEKYATTVSAISDKEIHLTRKSEGATGATVPITETHDLNGINGISFAGDSMQWSPDTGLYAFPLEIGKTWEVKSDFARKDGYSGSYTLTAKVVGYPTRRSWPSCWRSSAAMRWS